MFFPPFPIAPFPRNVSKKRSYFYNQITLYQKDRCKRNDGAAVSIATGLFFYAILLVCTPNRKKVRNDHEKTIAWHSAGVQHGADPAAGGGLCRGGQRRGTGRTARGEPGGTFNGVVVNRRGTINNGIFNDVVLNYSDGEIQGTFQAGIITGKGTAEDPYRISNAAQLKWFRNTVNSENCSICAALTADIDLENDPWTPIGTDFQNSYTGTFNGKGHPVKNLFINSGSLQYAGLFGYTKAAALRDLTVSGSVTSTAEDNGVGGIVGMAYGGVIENCGNLCTVIGKHTGGIAGRIQSAVYSGGGSVIVFGCYNAGAVTGSAFVGGIVGYGTSPEGNSIYDCYNVGSVELGNVQQDDPAAAAGGIAGPFDLCSVNNCYNTGAVFSSNGRAYGIGSHYNGPPALSNCYYLKGTAADRHSGAAETPAVDFAGGTVLTAHNGGTATCTAQASCMACGSGYGTVLGHDFTVRAYDEDEHWVKCSRCDAKRDEDAHDWDNGKITKQPACTNEGQKNFTCTQCGAEKQERIGANGHSWKNEWAHDGKHHWHECANANCDVTENRGKLEYGEHTGGTATCTRGQIVTFLWRGRA